MSVRRKVVYSNSIFEFVGFGRVLTERIDFGVDSNIEL